MVRVRTAHPTNNNVCWRQIIHFTQWRRRWGRSLCRTWLDATRVVSSQAYHIASKCISRFISPIISINNTHKTFMEGWRCVRHIPQQQRPSTAENSFHTTASTNDELVVSQKAGYNTGCTKSGLPHRVKIDFKIYRINHTWKSSIHQTHTDTDTHRHRDTSTEKNKQDECAYTASKHSTAQQASTTASKHCDSNKGD